MKRNVFCVGLILLLAFICLTILVKLVDVEPIGPNDSMVGFSTLNRAVHEFTGVHLSLYIITDYLSIIPIGIIILFGVVGLYEWIKRRSFLKVDFDILLLGLFYIVVMGIYVFFEFFVVNYRPILIDGVLEASYPSSTTFLVLTVMPTAVMQFNKRISNKVLKTFVNLMIIVFILFMIICRTLSGVHWFSDIIGGALLSSGLVLTYYALKK